MTSSSKVMSIEGNDKNAQPANVDNDKRFLIRQQLYYLFHAFRCTRLAYTTGQDDCRNQHCIMMRNVVKHITKCQSGKDCKFQHCPSSKEIIKHWKNCNDVECQVCAPLRRNNSVRKSMTNKNNMNGVSEYSEKVTNDKGGIKWQYKIQSIRPSFIAKLTDELIPVKVCEDVKNHSGYTDVSNYVKAFEFEIFQKSDSINDYLYKLAVKFVTVYRLLLSKRNPLSKDNNLSNEDDFGFSTQIEKFYQLIKSQFDKFYTPLSNENVKDNMEFGTTMKKEVTVISSEIKLESESQKFIYTMSGGYYCKSESFDNSNEVTANHQSIMLDLPPNNDAVNKTPIKKSIPAQLTNEIKMSPDSTSASTPNKDTTSQRKKWSAEELMNLFQEIHNTLMIDKDSEPFKEPVNWELLDIPDYPAIVKFPMDLSTIMDKLINGMYNDPWDVVDDFYLMFNNAWLYNKKTSKVYKMCSTLAKLFESKIDDIMVSCGFCCGREYVYLPQVLICCTPNVCLIVRDAVYYAFHNDKSNGEKIISELTCDRYICCEKCYNDSCEEVQFINAENNGAACKVKKSLLTKFRNNVKENEEFVFCRLCNRKWHKVCANHIDEIWKEGFVCPTCVQEKATIKIKPNIYKAKGLPHCKLSKFIENRVNGFLKQKDPTISEVLVRVLSSSDKVVEVKSGMKSHYCETCEMPESFKYRLKALFAFQEIDGQEVCFFGLHVQEYGSDCPDPNSRRVYLAYLDSVHYFKPRKLRTDVYHEFLVGYLEYVKILGFTMAHIWACPPGEGDDYIFHMHPPEQKLPKPKRLQEWYIKMLDKAMKENVVIDYKDIFSDALHSSMLSPTELPYFEGDYWPNALEEIFKEIDEETNRKTKSYSENPNSQETESSQLEVISKNNLSKMDKKPKKRKIKRLNLLNIKRKRSSGTITANDVSRKVLELMEKRKENFFVIRLHSQLEAANLPAIVDPDPLFHSDLMDGRDKLLCLAREKHLEFSSLRRAKFSTLCFCYELHMEQKNSVLYVCNACNKQIEVRYTCKQCEDFELCPVCYNTESHPHPLFKVDPDEESNVLNSQNLSQQSSELQDTYRARMVRYSKSLQHACQCRDVNCRIHLCAKMKGMIKHLQCCNLAKNTCKVCQLFLRICFVHAKFCSDPKCQVPNCLVLRFNWKQQGSQQRMQQAQMLRRRVALMQRGMHPETPGSVSVNLTPQSPVNTVNTPLLPPPPPPPPASVEPPMVPVPSNNEKDFNECDTIKKPNVSMQNYCSYSSSNAPQSHNAQIEPQFSSGNPTTYNSMNVSYSADTRTITNDDIKTVFLQYHSFERNYPNKEEFQKCFGNWLNTNPKYRMAFDLLLRKSKLHQNEMVGATNTSYVGGVRPMSEPKNVYTGYSQHTPQQWQPPPDNVPNNSCSYPQIFTYYNSEPSNNLGYEYTINSSVRPTRPALNNSSIYVTSIPQNVTLSHPTISTIHADPMQQHLNMNNRISKIPFPPNHSSAYLATSSNYVTNFPNNVNGGGVVGGGGGAGGIGVGVQCLPPQPGNVRFPPQSMMTSAKNVAQPQSYRLPQTFHDSSHAAVQPNIGHKHQMVAPSFPPSYYSQTQSQIDQLAGGMPVSPLIHSPGIQQNYNQVMMNSNINNQSFVTHQKNIQ